MKSKTTQQPIDLSATHDQIEVINCPSRFIGLFAGRRWGKTVAAKYRILRRCTEKKIKYWYIAPSYSQVWDLYQQLAFDPAWRPWIKSTRQQPYPQIHWWNGSETGLRSFERPDNLKGAGLDECWVDEIQDIDNRHFWPVLRPLLSDRRGTLAVSGQFRGKNWYYKEFFEKGQQDTTLYRSYRFPSSSGLVYQGPEGRAELELARQQIPRIVFEQEYECLPVANQNCAFDPHDIEGVTRAQQLPNPRSGARYIIGCDLGRVRDYTALVVLEIESGLIAHAERLPLGMKHEEQAHRVKQIVDKWRGQLVIDATGGANPGAEKQDAFIEFYRRLIPNLRPFYWSAKNKERVIQHLALEIERGLISIPPELRELIDELLAYEFEYRSGTYFYSSPSGLHDDYVTALALAVWARHLGWFPTTSGLPLSAAF